MSAEYIMAGGNENVILCERGIRTFEKYTRNTLDLSVVPIIKEKTHLPIIIDPSHATGDWRYVESMSLAAIAAGADGLIIEVHENPEAAWSRRRPKPQAGAVCRRHREGARHRARDWARNVSGARACIPQQQQQERGRRHARRTDRGMARRARRRAAQQKHGAPRACLRGAGTGRKPH